MFFFSVLYQGQFLHLDLQSLHELLIFHPFSAAVMAKDSSVKTQLLHKDSHTWSGQHLGLDIDADEQTILKYILEYVLNCSSQMKSKSMGLFLNKSMI